MDNISKYIFRPELGQEYIKEFNDYVISVLYPDLHRAEDFK